MSHRLASPSLAWSFVASGDPMRVPPIRSVHNSGGSHEAPERDRRTLQDDYQRLQLPKRALALVLAGGRGSRLYELTDRRAKPAVFFGGKFRIVDFVLSNCLNSGIRRIGMLTQYKAHSLLRHLQGGWSFLRSEANEFIDLLPAQQRIDEASWYRGTADAVYQKSRHHPGASP